MVEINVGKVWFAIEVMADGDESQAKYLDLDNAGFLVSPFARVLRDAGPIDGVRFERVFFYGGDPNGHIVTEEQV